MATPRTIVHLTAECFPYARTGGLAEAVQGLAAAQARAGRRVIIILPLYRAVRGLAPALEPVGSPLELMLGGRVETGRLFRVGGPPAPGVPTVYALEHQGYFDRDGIYGEGGSDYADNPRRFGFFCRAVLELLPLLDTGDTVLHAHDWHAALAAVYLRTHAGLHGLSARTRVVLTAHNPGYQGHFPADICPDLDIPWEVYNWRQLEWYGQANLLKGGMVFADEVVTVSPTHARELLTPDGGFGLHEVFQALGDRFSGIINGIDQAVWSPGTDPHIAARYTAEQLDGKRRCKAELQRAYGLPEYRDVPLFGFSGRLVQQKGLSIILASEALLAERAQFVFLGTGEKRFADALRDLARRLPDRVGVQLAFSDPLEHRLIAGADLFLMPSQYEPCGLTQMRAQRYGTIPVARRVGGIADTVQDGITGFLFDAFDGAALDASAARALQEFRQERRWRDTMRHAMRTDFSWQGPMQRYFDVYAHAEQAASAA